MTFKGFGVRLYRICITEIQWLSVKFTTSDSLRCYFPNITPLTSGRLVEVSQVWDGAWPAVHSLNQGKSNQHLYSFMWTALFERYRHIIWYESYDMTLRHIMCQIQYDIVKTISYGSYDFGYEIARKFKYKRSCWRSFRNESIRSWKILQCNFSRFQNKSVHLSRPPLHCQAFRSYFVRWAGQRPPVSNIWWPALLRIFLGKPN